MKIIRLTTLLDFGGQEKQYLTFTENNNMLNNQYIFAAIGHGGYAGDIIKDRGFEVKIFNLNPAIRNVSNIWIIYKWFKQIKPDIVHTAAAEANFHGIIAAKLAGVKVVIAEEIGFPNHSKTTKLVFRLLYKFTSKVVCVSKSVKYFLIGINEIDDEKGVVIYNPVSNVKVIDRKHSKEFTIVTIGRLEKVKNQQLLIRGFSKIDNQSSRLIIVGDGRERKHLEQLILDLKLEKRVSMIGFVDNPEYYLSHANLFVLPSLSEGFGIAVVEAMLQGVPCLCSNVGGIPEFIDKNETGWLFNPNDENELVEKINLILTLSSDELESVGINGRKKVENRFSLQKYIDQLENLYDKLL